MSKRATPQQLADALQQSHFGESRQLKPADPVAPTSMVRKITEIKLYDRNPRWAPNERYAEIKESIRTRGLETPLPITRRPDDDLYMVAKGGNTRLAILNELYEETEEQRFFEVRCDFNPWVSEPDTLIAHLTENDKRGDLVFIDRARGIRDFRKLLEEQYDKKLTFRELAEELSKLGYYQDPPRLARMHYAVEVLLPALPESLAAGMGRRQIEAIRRLERAAERLWEQACIRDEFQPIFQQLLHRYDGDNWDYDKLRIAIIKEIEVASEIDQFNVAEVLDQLLDPEKASNETNAIPKSTEDQVVVSILTPSPGLQKSNATSLDLSSENPTDQEIFTLGDASDFAITQSLSEEVGQDDFATAAILGADLETQEDLIFDVSSDRTSFDTLFGDGQSNSDLQSLRTTAWTLAARLAERNQLDNAVVSFPSGFGFIVTDLPDQKLAAQPDTAQYEKICALWWQLVACSETLVAPVEIILSLLPEQSKLCSVFPKQRLELVEDHLVPLNHSQIGIKLWCAINDSEWNNLLQLMGTYRKIKLLAAACEIDLWR